jgi:hypothetical protein
MTGSLWGQNPNLENPKYEASVLTTGRGFYLWSILVCNIPRKFLMFKERNFVDILKIRGLLRNRRSAF